MDPKEFIQSLKAGVISGKADLKLVNSGDRNFLVYGNNFARGVYELGATGLEANVDSFIFDNKYSSISDLHGDTARINDFFNSLEEEIKTKPISLVKQYDRKQLVDLYNSNKEQDAFDPNIKEKIAASPATPKSGQQEPSGFQYDFRSPGKGTLSLGVAAYNGVVGAPINAVGATVGTAYDILSEPIDGTTKFLKTVWNTAVDLIGTGTALGGNFYAADPNKGFLENMFQAYNMRKDMFQKSIGDALQIDYNSDEKKLNEDFYKKNYTDFFDQIKEKVQIDIKPPSGDPDWNNPEWIDNQLGSALTSGIEFMGGLYLGNAALMKVGSKVGGMLGETAGKFKVRDFAKAIEKSDAPELIKDMARSKLEKTSIYLEDAKNTGSMVGTQVGSQTAMVLGTKYEADLEAKGAYKQYMDENKQLYVNSLMASGVSEEEANAAFENSPIGDIVKQQAITRAENVRMGNLAILGLSNLATFSLLGLLPKSIGQKFIGQELGELTKDLTTPWIKKVGNGALESFKEGWEEVIQNSMVNYELGKDTNRSSLVETIASGFAKGVSDLVTVDPEASMAFIGGMLPSAAMSGGKYGFDKYREKRDGKVAQNFIKPEMVNSIFNGPISNSEVQTAHAIHVAAGLQNAAGKEAAETTKDWQLGHVLQMEGIKKLYYEARENGVDSEAAKRQILKVVQANPDLKGWSKKLNTEYVGVHNEKQVMSEIEKSMQSAERSYDSLHKEIKRLKTKDIVLTPERKRNLFEAISNRLEFQELGEFIKEQEDSDKKNNDLKVNDAYIKAYDPVFKELLKTSDIKNDQNKGKKMEVKEALKESEKPESKEVSSADIVKNSEYGIKDEKEVESIKSDLKRENINSDVETLLDNLDTSISQLFKDGMIPGKANLNYDEINTMFEEFDKSFSEVMSRVEDPRERLEYQRKVSQVYNKHIDKLRNAAGNVKSIDDLEDRYNSLEKQKAFLFFAERDLLLAKTRGKVSDTASEKIKNMENIDDLKALLQDETLSDMDRRIINSFYAEPAAVSFEDDGIDALTGVGEITIEAELPDNDVFDTEFNEETIDDLIREGIIVGKCD